MASSTVDRLVADEISELETIVPVRAAAIAGLTELAEAYKSIGSENIEAMSRSVRALSAIKSPSDFFGLQQKLMTEGTASAVRNGVKLAGLTTSLFTSMMSPVQARTLSILGAVPR
ncbi:phasin family protein [Sphingobium sp. D43FB]|uniref:phasin family protein n=1 Tax=Sphingobium sp. D43FB TaxID=2017595 RepID=UPI000BB59450|nr:phasin family protein [Sphingobium sp. D43FB]PBN43608.1 hypothetical protein SxD43FB_10960 [Sphingobium sp. D43FB]